MSGDLPQPGEFVEVRGRRWLVEGRPMLEGVGTVRLACVDDDAQGEVVEVAWPAELDAALDFSSGEGDWRATADSAPVGVAGPSSRARVACKSWRS